MSGVSSDGFRRRSRKRRFSETNQLRTLKQRREKPDGFSLLFGKR